MSTDIEYDARILTINKRLGLECDEAFPRIILADALESILDRMDGIDARSATIDRKVDLDACTRRYWTQWKG